MAVARWMLAQPGSGRGGWHGSSGRLAVTGEQRVLKAPGDAWELWTWRDVARVLHVSRSWVYMKAQSGALPSLRVCGLLRFDPAAVREFALGGRKESTVVPMPSRAAESG